MNRAIKIIELQGKDFDNKDSIVNKFLNDNDTGEIYDVKIVQYSHNPRFVTYSFLYELLDDNDNSKINIKQRKIENIKSADKKPKLI